MAIAERTRDAERTKEAILVAAEDCFARLGFGATSLQQIGEAAGVARSTPAYFFGGKETLYEYEPSTDRTAYNRVLGSANAVNRAIEREILRAWGRLPAEARA